MIRLLLQTGLRFVAHPNLWGEALRQAWFFRHKPFREFRLQTMYGGEKADLMKRVNPDDIYRFVKWAHTASQQAKRR
jgi:hypothetical protein